MEKNNLIKDLGNGLILRHAALDDKEELAAFNGRIHSDEGPDKPDKWIIAWTKELMTRSHPTFDIRDFTIVENTKTGKIVSSLNLIPQTWSYDGIPFEVGRPELVGTDPEYRKKGLVREQMEVVHQWSEERSHLVQAITGIPWYYRQFGYEMGLALGGGRVGYLPNIPKLKKGEKEKFTFRLAKKKDIPFLMEIAELASKRSLIYAVRDQAMWGHEISGRSKLNGARIEIRIIEDTDSKPIGYIAHPFRMWGPTLTLTQYELQKGVNWLDVTPSVIRYIQKTGEKYAAKEKKKLEAFGFWVGTEHPVYNAVQDRLPRVRDSYAWYVRVPDIPAFLNHIKPVLEKRLADSIAVGFTGDLKLSFFRDGVKLTFKSGKLAEISEWMPKDAEDGDALFPDFTFLQVLFGYRSFEELEAAYADCYLRNDNARALIPILFPKIPSQVWPIA